MVSQSPTVDGALLEIVDSDIVHCACHGISAPASPLESRLALMNATRDGVENLTVRELIESTSKAHCRKLAYLSACSSARISSETFLNEGIDIASAFQLAGFQHVIETLWEADDDTSKQVSVEFYKTLLAMENPLGDAGIPTALHQAVKNKLLTDTRLVNAPLLWVPFVHFGC